MKSHAKRRRTGSLDVPEAERPVKKAATSSTFSPPMTPSSSSAAAVAATAKTPAATQRQPCRNALLVVSTYHGVMAGLVYRKEKFYIKFSVKRHAGQVNGTAVTQRYIASSGVDERVFLFTNKAEERLTAAARKKMREAGEPLAIRLADLGSVAPPAEVIAMAFTDGSQSLLCGCADGHLLIYRCRDWSVVATLTVHERAVLALAVHPGSRGGLAVTIGEDRAVAVLDLLKGTLLTKWKYTPVIVGKAEKEGGGQMKEVNAAQASSAAVPRSVFAPARETPVGVLFSPRGTRLAIFSRFSFVVYDAAVMQPLCTFRSAAPQPPAELHCCAFYTEDLLLFGTEAGVLRQFSVVGTAEAPVQVVAELAAVEVAYPEAVAAHAAQLLAGPVKADVETRQKNPLRHVNRIKALRLEGATIFSIDSSGIVVAWSAQCNAGATSDSALHVQYVTSANCQGRVTGMELYPL